MKKGTCVGLVFLALFSLRAQASEGPGYSIRIETRNLGCGLNNILNAKESDKVVAFIAVLRTNTKTDVFLVDELGQDMRKLLVQSVGSRYEVLMWPQSADVGILVDRERVHGLRSIDGSMVAWISTVGFGLLAGSNGKERYAWLSKDFDCPMGRLRLISLHAVSAGNWGAVRKRADMFDSVREWVEKGLDAGMAVILAGDFNMQFAPKSFDADQVAARRLFEMAATRSRPAAYTERSFFGKHELDYILAFVRAPLAAGRSETAYATDNTHVQTIPRTDHLMLRTEFVFSSRTAPK